MRKWTESSNSANLFVDNDEGCGDGEMLKMSQIETIKNMQSKGLGPSAIAERLQIDRKTVRKVMASETFEQRKPKAAVAQPSKLDPYKPLIQSWLEEDRKNRYKQRHTAQRIHNRLVAECPEYDASYPLVQRYVRSLREARHQEGTLEMEWPPGEAQVDFGEAGMRTARRKSASSYVSPSPTATQATRSCSAVRRPSAWCTVCGISFTGLAVFRVDWSSTMPAA